MTSSPNTAPRLTWPKASVAHALGISEATFDKKRAILEREHGFPAKLPGLNMWSIPAIRSWISSNGQSIAPLPVPNDDPEIGAIVSALELEYGSAAP